MKRNRDRGETPLWKQDLVAALSVAAYLALAFALVLVGSHISSQADAFVSFDYSHIQH